MTKAVLLEIWIAGTKVCHLLAVAPPVNSLPSLSPLGANLHMYTADTIAARARLSHPAVRTEASLSERQMSP